LRVLGPIKTTLGLSAAVQGRFLGWGNVKYRGFRVATGKTGFAGIFDLHGFVFNFCLFAIFLNFTFNIVMWIGRARS